MAVLKYYNTTTSAWEYIAASTTANFTTWKKTMAGGETSVSGTDDNGVTLSYTVGLEQVFINGALQARGSDYIATTGTTVTGLSALGANDIVSVVCYAPFNVTNTYTKSETDGVAAAAPGMRLIVPSSVSVGSGSASVDANGAVTFSGASTVTISNAFSANYDSYKILITGGADTANNTLLYLKLGSTTTGYYGVLQYSSYSTGGLGVLADNNAAQWSYVGASGTSGLNADIQLLSPFLSKQTHIVASYYDSTNAAGKIGYLANTTSYTDFTFSGGGTISGTARIYGYKD
jgi:hypothetical protein